MRAVVTQGAAYFGKDTYQMVDVAGNGWLEPDLPGDVIIAQ